jgi:hypothetical protein
MAKRSLASMSIEALLKLRDDIGTVLSQGADELRSQLSRLGGPMAPGTGRRESAHILNEGSQGGAQVPRPDYRRDVGWARRTSALASRPT